MLYFSLTLSLPFMHLFYDILAPVKSQVRDIRSVYNFPPEPSFKKALHKQGVVSLAYVCSIARIHNGLIWLCEIERNVDIVGEVDLEQEIKEVFEFLHVLVISISADLETHSSRNHRFGDMNNSLSC